LLNIHHRPRVDAEAPPALRARTHVKMSKACMLICYVLNTHVNEQVRC
jgi:hypothetical protein